MGIRILTEWFFQVGDVVRYNGQDVELVGSGSDKTKSCGGDDGRT